MIELADFLLFSARTLDGYRRALERLDDNTMNALPDLPSPNTPFQLVTHALAAADWWTDHIVLGNPSDRDRPSEFTASGSVAEAMEALHAAQVKLYEIGPQLDNCTSVAHPPKTETPLEGEWTVGACLIHAYEELAQHLGHLQITVDLVAG